MRTSTQIETTSVLVGEEKAVEYVAKAGFDAWDFSMFAMCDYDWRLGAVRPTTHPLAGENYLAFARKLKQIGLDNGITCNQSHAPFPTSCPEIRSYFKRAIECTAEAGGKIGDVVSVCANENVGYWHQAHSFVRGNWRNSDQTSPMILQKCCHDMDIYTWLLGKKCKAISSVGDTHLFKKECAPEGATPYCLGGCKAKENCKFDAEKIYITNPATGIRNGNTWMAGVACGVNPTEERTYEALKNGQYGRCVYMCDNNVVDHQQTNLLFEDDRCTALVYPEAENAGRVATLCDLRQKLLEQPEDKAREIALSLELYTTGSLDIFGRESTVDLNKPYVVFDIHGLGEQLKPAGSLVITDTILNRVTLNWKRGKRTHVFIDEFHVMFENEQSGIFFNSAWRQFRKRGAYPTAITQNVEYLLDSVQASTMLSNSEFIVMLNQAASDRAKLAKLLNISNEQMSYVTNADAGCGLIRYGSALVPFINRFPRDTKLYALMTTKPGEGVFGGEEVPA